MDYANNKINCKRIPNHDVDVFWSLIALPLLSKRLPQFQWWLRFQRVLGLEIRDIYVSQMRPHQSPYFHWNKNIQFIIAFISIFLISLPRPVDSSARGCVYDSSVIQSYNNNNNNKILIFTWRLRRHSTQRCKVLRAQACFLSKTDCLLCQHILSTGQMMWWTHGR